MDDIRRGEIFYIARGGATNGSEQFADRPAVVVSNDENNKHSGVIEVVYMTTQPKTDLPTHVTIRSTGRISTVLCEQVSSVSTERVNNYIGQVSKQYNETIQRQQEEIDSLKREIEMLQQECDDRIAEIEQDAAVYAEENRKVDASRQSEDIIKVQTERDTFKALYEQLFERLLTMGGTGN